MSVNEILSNKSGQVNKITSKYRNNYEAKDIETSIIIRTKNEERYLEHVLLMLKKQTYRNFEIVIVDDNSTDKTVEIAKKYNCKIVKIPEGKFNYPYACNFGIRESIGEYIVFLSGHSIPINTEWLEKGLKNFKSEKVAGVYAYPLSHYGVTPFQRMLYFFSLGFGKKRFIIGNVKNMKIGRFDPYFHMILFQWFPIFVAKKMKIGALGFTNAIIRRDLWEKYNLNEKFAGGGED
ncbi:MAG: glycosyltransferase family A protein, partial [Candidatus Hermodarchaeota archaeon]